MSAQVSIDQIIYYYISQAHLTEAHYARLYPLAVRGLIDLSLDLISKPKTERLDVSTTKTATLPPTYMKWVKIGVLNDNGEVMTLRRNINLTKYAATDVDRLSKNTDGSTGGLHITPDQDNYQNFTSDGAVVNLFGISSPLTYNGEFTVDEANNVILLSNDYGYDYVILEYLENPLSAADLALPMQAQEALIAWLAWQDIASLPQGRRSNEGMIARKERQYYKQRSRARERLNPFRISDFNEAIRINNRLILKG